MGLHHENIKVSGYPGDVMSLVCYAKHFQGTLHSDCISIVTLVTDVCNVFGYDYTISKLSLICSDN